MQYLLSQTNIYYPKPIFTSPNQYLLAQTNIY
jgi:hypothetical protein